MISRALLALLSVAALAGCGGALGVATSPTSSSTSTMSTSEAPATRRTVTLGVYSGRPDPSWDLTAAQVARVEAAIAALPVTTGTPPEGGLGYHGFTLLLGRPGKADETLVAYRGIVAPPGVDPRPYRIDAGRTVERLLLHSGRSILTPTEVAAVEVDLATDP
jgi:predicted small lipoprotein YifL